MGRRIGTRRWLAMLSVGSLALLAGCDKAAQERPSPPPPIVTVASPIFEPFTNYDEYTARITPAEQVELRARVGGYLEKIHFEPGSFVQQGDLLFTIDQSTYAASMRRAEAGVESARAAEALAQATLERNRPLIEQGVISSQEFDVFAAQLKSAQAATIGAEAALEAAKLDLSFTEIMAPIAGRITNNLVDAGNLVQANATLLATIVAQDPMHAYFDIDENSLLRYRREHPPQAASEEDQQQLRARQIPVLLALADSRDFSFQGIIDYGDPFVNPATGTVRVRGSFDNADRKLTAGLFARVRIASREAVETIRIPIRAVGTDQDRKFVYVLDESGTAQYRQVRLGAESGPLVVVEEGLSPSDKVVIDGILRLRPGVKPDAKPADMSVFTGAATP